MKCTLRSVYVCMSIIYVNKSFIILLTRKPLPTNPHASRKTSISQCSSIYQIPLQLRNSWPHFLVNSKCTHFELNYLAVKYSPQLVFSVAQPIIPTFFCTEMWNVYDEIDFENILQAHLQFIEGVNDLKMNCWAFINSRICFKEDIKWSNKP